MDPELYNAAQQGDVEYLQRNRTQEVDSQDRRSDEFFLKRTQHGDNNILHIAARAGHDTFVEEALYHFPVLSDEVNSQGDTPLLVAARFGHLQVVKKLAEIITNSSQRDLEQGLADRQLEDVLLINSEQGTTAIHEALRNGHEDVARYLLKLKPEMATFHSRGGESPLFLAAESCCQRFVVDILQSGWPYSTKGPNGQNALHAARNYDVPMMNPELYKAAKEGDMLIFDGLRPVFGTEEVANQHGIVVRTLRGNNNILHIAARAGRDEFVAKALEYFPFLANQVNSQRDTPLLVAARFGHLEVVKELTRSATENGTNSGRSRLPGGAVEELVHRQSEQDTRQVGMAPAAENESNPSSSHPQSAAEEDRIDLSLEEGNNIPAGMVAVLAINQTNSSSSRQRHVGEGQVDHQSDALIPSHWRVTNLKGATVTTALHEALRNKHQNMARHILRSNPGMAAFDNLAGESPLFLAAESGCELFMSDILLSDERYSTNGPKEQNALHAARYCCGAIISELIKQNPDLMRKLDDQGKAAVHYALEGKYWGFLDRMLAADPSIALFPDSDGFTPLLIAASEGYWQTCKYILEICPESIEACNFKGQNTLHLSYFGNFFHGLHFLRIPEIWDLRNVGDHEGNTPLHLAVKRNDIVKAVLLTLSASVDLGAVNIDGFTALDLCGSDTKYNKQRIMSWFLMVYLSPRGRRPNGTEEYYLTYAVVDVDVDFKPFMKTIILVATLIATVTFTAAFTMPGGFDTRPKKEGVATLVTKVALKVFILSDTFAMCCSVTVVLLLTMAMLAERDVLPSIADKSIMLLYLASLATLVAFMSGIFAVIAPKALWVAISVCIVCTAAPFLIGPSRLPGFPYASLLRPAIFYRLFQGLKQKRKHCNRRKSEQRYVGSLIERGTPDPTYCVSNTNTVAN